VESVFIDVGTNRRDFGDLMSNRVKVFALEGGPTASTVRRLDLERLSEVLGRDQRPGVALVSRLAPALPPRRRNGRPPLELDGGRVGRGRLGGVGGVLIELGLQIGDPLLQRGDHSQDGRLGFRGYGAPERFGDRRVRAHTADSTSLLYKEFGPVNGYPWG
jgi:hypothetical protein